MIIILKSRGVAAKLKTETGAINTVTQNVTLHRTSSPPVVDLTRPPRIQRPHPSRTPACRHLGVTSLAASVKPSDEVERHRSRGGVIGGVASSARNSLDASGASGW